MPPSTGVLNSLKSMYLRRHLLATFSIFIIFFLTLLISFYIWVTDTDSSAFMFLTGVMLLLLGVGFVVYAVGFCF